MKKLIYFFVVLILALSAVTVVYSQQYCIPGRFDTSYVFAPAMIDTQNVVYGNNIDYLGNPVNLSFLIAYPNTAIDPLPKRPFVLLIHGGGYVDGDKYQLQPVMMDLAMRGYVCASIDYRIGWLTGGNPFACNGSGYSLVQAIYRAVQDSKAAFRYFAFNADLYKIDTAYMFSGGISAGAVTSLLVSYASEQHFTMYYPNIVNELGGLNTATNGYTSSFKVKGILSSSGGILDTSFIVYSNFTRSSNAVPTLMFHGTADPNVPYGTGYAYSCPNYVGTQGAQEITKRLRTIVVPLELNYVPGGGHENFYPIPYIQLRTSMFLKRYLCNDFRQIINENYTNIIDTNIGWIVTGGIAHNKLQTADYKLHQNYPNPFNPVTKISYELPANQFVSLRVYNMLGREVSMLVNENKQAGKYTVDFNASDLTSGVYFYVLRAGDFKATGKMVLAK